MRQAWIIAAKDLKLRVRDRSVFIVGIIAPLGLAAIFSSIFNPIEDFDFSATYAVVDQDGGFVATQFVGGLEQFGAGAEIIKVATRQEAMDLAAVEPFTSGEGVDAAFVIPPGFSDAIQSDPPAEPGGISGPGGVAASVAVAFAAQAVSGMTLPHLGGPRY